MDETNFIRRQLGIRLRTLREAAGLSRTAVYQAELIKSPRILKALEDGKSTTVTYPVIGALCRFYGATEPMRRETERMFRNVGSDEWRETPERNWHDQTVLLVQIERISSEMLIYEPNNLVGLLQSESYIRRRFTERIDSQSGMELLLNNRIRRQQAVWRDGHKVDIRAISTASVINEMTEDEKKCLLDRLEKLDGVELRVLDDSDEAELLYHYHFILHLFGSPTNGCVYTETVSAHRYESHPDALESYRKFFEMNFERSIPIREFLHG
jgi:Domain of unknown function (DUF5753)/Helix-turn-helix domain